MREKVLAVGLLALACGAAPVIRENSVSFAQDPATRLVSVTYTLDEDPGIITFDVLTNGVTIGAANIKALAGDVNRLVQTGDRTIYWRPDLSWPGHKITDNSVTVAVTAWATNTPPDYMMIDISLGGRTIPLEERTTYYTHPDAIPFPGGVTNDLCKTDYLVFRKCPAANVTWRMGTTATEQGGGSSVPAAHYVTFTNDFWMGVYEVTQRQYHHFGVGKADAGCCFTNECAMRPVEYLQFYWQRGWSDLAASAIAAGTRKYWPETGHEILATDAKSGTYGSAQTNTLYRVRLITGLPVDFPTEAQWEFAARAGKGGNLPDGTAFSATVDGETGAERLHRYARTAANGGKVDGAPSVLSTSAAGPTCNDPTKRPRLATTIAEGGPTNVGSFEPNAWGIYDMCGNVSEMCLDNWQETFSADAVTDPEGPETSGKKRAIRGGSWGDVDSNCLTTSRKTVNNSVNMGYNDVGFRFCIVIP